MEKSVAHWRSQRKRAGCSKWMQSRFASFFPLPPGGKCRTDTVAKKLASYGRQSSTGGVCSTSAFQPGTRVTTGTRFNLGAIRALAEFAAMNSLEELYILARLRVWPPSC